MKSNLPERSRRRGWSVWGRVAGLLGLAASAWAVSTAQAAPADGARWAASWAGAPIDFKELTANPNTAALPMASGSAFRNQTVRQQMPISLGGERVRVRFSNRFGLKPLQIAAASVARSTGQEALSPATLKLLHFGGRNDVTIAPGAEAWSDGVDLRVDAGQVLAVSTFLEKPTPYATVRVPASVTNWVVGGNAVAVAKPRGAQPLPLGHIVTGLDVAGPGSPRVVVAFGDSITAGGSEDEHSSYPDFLAKRLRDGPKSAPVVAVINEGIGGNRLLLDGIGPRGIARFAPDALAQSGVTHVVVLMGTNDIGRAVFAGAPGLPPVPPQDVATAERITAGLERIVKAAHDKGVKVVLGTVPPFKHSPYWSEETEAMRSAVNRWIRGRQGVDGVVDFDAALRGAEDPLALNPPFDSGDHLHPNRAGHAAMAEAIDLHTLQE